MQIFYVMIHHFTNIIHIDGREYTLLSNPLSIYFEMKKISIEGYCTSCWEGYLSDWDIVDERLYLVDVLPCFTDEEGEKVVTMENLFPGQDEIFANWYTGELLALDGDMQNYVHLGDGPICGKHIHIQIKDGVVTDFRVEESRKE